MKVLITGASSGIGESIAKYLYTLGHDLILVARDREKLQAMQERFKGNTKIIIADLSNEAKVKELYVICKNENIDILVNNAGFGLFGDFSNTDLTRELEMIDLNIKAVHILTKMFLRDMKKRGSGYILNVASSAGFIPGPLMATYYSTKSYVLNLTLAINEELRRDKSKVKISCLCPGPVATNFNNIAGVNFGVKPLKSNSVAKYAIDEMFKNKVIIVPGIKMRLALFFRRFVSLKFIARITYNIQKKKSTSKMTNDILE